MIEPTRYSVICSSVNDLIPYNGDLFWGDIAKDDYGDLIKLEEHCVIVNKLIADKKESISLLDGILQETTDDLVGLLAFAFSMWNNQAITTYPDQAQIIRNAIDKYVVISELDKIPEGGYDVPD